MVKVSIIIPTYNEERYIGKCLDSLLNQTYKDFEIILVDDGSKDKTVEVLREYEKQYKNVTVLTQEHKGPGVARNLGANKANGEILVLVDADMEFDSNYIKKLVKPILDGSCIGTSHLYEYVANKDNIWARCWGLKRAWFGRTDKNKKIKNDMGVGIFRAILKREFLELGGFNPKRGYWDDESLYGKITKKSLAVEDAICYHNNPTSLKEIYGRTKWIGGSFMVNYHRIPERIKRFRYLALSVVLLLSIFLFFMRDYSLQNIAVSLLIVLPAVLIAILTIRRTLRERHLRYVVFLPVFYIVRILGLIHGAMRQIPNILVSKIQGKEVIYKY